ncbi:GGDEF domain-containing protein [Legionella sp. km772]|uniref:GGDEF domain-containing protein n=1 Tax=Legionella sp. km772 TaxID=2498111 RepID=UPI001F3EEEC8|nr:GGDEF domain-containing protein [Legionella sp. km772]
MGATWGLSYFIFLPYFNGITDSLYILVLGGLAAGSIASMSMCMPAYYAYVFPMFLPLILYNLYLMQVNNLILALMYALFLLMVFLVAQFNARLLLMTSKLNKEKDQLIEQLTETNLKLSRSIEEVRTMSITDSLTNIFNRRYFDMILGKELSRAKRGNYDINLVFIDIDNFKWINDNFGHPSGDEFLIYVADILNSLIRRASDIIFRLGGDEFAVILSMPSNEVAVFCSRIQAAFDKNNKYKNVTLSMGIVALKPSHVTDSQSIISAADHSLYEAKKSGKNKIILNSLE